MSEISDRIVTLLTDEAKKDGSSGQLSVDTLRRKLQTTKANILDALTELEGAGTIEFDPDDQLAQLAEDVEVEQVIEQDVDEAINGEPSEEEIEENAERAAEEEDEPVGKFRFPDSKKVEYEEKGGHCGDKLAEALTAFLNDVTFVPRKDGKGEKKVKGISMEAVRQVMGANGIKDVKGNNPGQIRMNLSNMLRSKWRNGTAIVVGDTVIPGIQYKSPKQWQQEWANLLIVETKENGKATITRKAAEAQAEQAFETKAAAMEYDPYTGTFID